MIFPTCQHMGFFGYGWIIQIGIILAFFLIILWLLKNGKLSTRINDDSPVEILKKRLAKGELTKKEYESLKKELDEDTK